MNYYTSHKGATLIEILVSLVVISVGMIGVAALQVTQLHQVTRANQDYIVSQQINDMADRIRANPVGASNGDYNSIGASSTQSDNDCSSDCSPTELATFDAIQWNQNNAILLPNGTGTVTSSDNQHFTITLTWEEKDSTTPQTFTASITL